MPWIFFFYTDVGCNLNVFQIKKIFAFIVFGDGKVYSSLEVWKYGEIDEKRLLMDVGF